MDGVRINPLVIKALKKLQAVNVKDSSIRPEAYMLMGYKDEKSNEVILVEEGESTLYAIFDKIPPEEPRYILWRTDLKLGVAHSAKFIFISYLPKSLKSFRKAVVGSHQAKIKEILAPIHIFWQASDMADLRSEEILAKLGISVGTRVSMFMTADVPPSLMLGPPGKSPPPRWGPPSPSHSPVNTAQPRSVTTFKTNTSSSTSASSPAAAPPSSSTPSLPVVRGGGGNGGGGVGAKINAFSSPTSSSSSSSSSKSPATSSSSSSSSSSTSSSKWASAFTTNNSSTSASANNERAAAAFAALKSPVVGSPPPAATSSSSSSFSSSSTSPATSPQSSNPDRPRHHKTPTPAWQKMEKMRGNLAFAPASVHESPYSPANRDRQPSTSSTSSTSSNHSSHSTTSTSTTASVAAARKEREQREQQEKEREQKAIADREKAQKEKEQEQQQQQQQQQQQREKEQKEQREREQKEQREKEQKERDQKDKEEREKQRKIQEAEAEALIAAATARLKKQEEAKQQRDKEKAEKEKADKEKAEKEKTERAERERERVEKEKLEKDIEERRRKESDAKKATVTVTPARRESDKTMSINANLASTASPPDSPTGAPQLPVVRQSVVQVHRNTTVRSTTVRESIRERNTCAACVCKGNFLFGQEEELTGRKLCRKCKHNVIEHSVVSQAAFRRDEEERKIKAAAFADGPRESWASLDNLILYWWKIKEDNPCTAPVEDMPIEEQLMAGEVVQLTSWMLNVTDRHYAFRFLTEDAKVRMLYMDDRQPPILWWYNIMEWDSTRAPTSPASSSDAIARLEAEQEAAALAAAGGGDSSAPSFVTQVQNPDDQDYQARQTDSQSHNGYNGLYVHDDDE